MKLQVFSDIHLEFGAPAPPRTTGDVIVAAGDIGVGLEGLVWLSQFDCEVVYVAGNHEFYDCDLDETRAELADLAGHLGIHFLDNSAVEIGGVRFLGSTLWTDFDNKQAPLYHHAADMMNDFRMVRRHGRNLTPNDCVALHQASLAWLGETLAEPARQPRVQRSRVARPTSSARSDTATDTHRPPPGQMAAATPANTASTSGNLALSERVYPAVTQPHTQPAAPHAALKTVVVTHHAPSARSWSVSRDLLLRPAYCNKMEAMLAAHPIDLWVHGHVHDRLDYTLHDTRVVCNPRGYAGYQTVTDHDPALFIELET